MYVFKWYLKNTKLQTTINNISCDTKRKMISALNLIEDTDESDVIDTERIRRVELKTDDYSKSIDKELKYFLSAKTKKFFHNLI